MPGIERDEALHGGPCLKPATPRNLAASIRQKLLNLAARQGEDFGLSSLAMGWSGFSTSCFAVVTHSTVPQAQKQAHKPRSRVAGMYI